MELNPAITTPPPPQRPSLGLRDRPVRLAGIVLACSTPITGFLSYALIAILFGETRLESSNGLTSAGIAALAGPALLGAVLVLWSFVTPKTPTRQTFAALTATIGAALLVVGLWSTLSASGDASIGGGLLVLASLPLGVIAFLLFRAKPTLTEDISHSH